MNLQRVRPGYYLHFPPKIDSGDNPLMGGPGAVIDMEDAFVRECVLGQEYKLAPAPEATAADPITHTRFRVLRADFQAKASGVASSATATPEKPTDESIPKPDARPKKSEEKKHGALPAPVSQGNSR